MVNDNLKKSRRGLSTIIATILLVLLSLVIISVVWVVVKNLITEQTENVQSCFNVFDKLTTNDRFTCYNSTNQELQVSIDIGELNLEQIVISVSNPSATKTFRISKQNTGYSDIKLLNGNYNDILPLPNTGEGLTYVIDVASAGVDNPVSLKIAPVVNGDLCEVTDSVDRIVSCSVLA